MDSSIDKPRKPRFATKTFEEIERNPPAAPPPEVIERYMRRSGRKPLYETPEEMQEIIMGYFRSNMTEVLDENGEHRGYQWAGRISLGDLAIYLGMQRQQLWEYGQRDKFADTVKSAKEIIENYYEKILQENRNPAGICFILKNGFGWRDVQDITITPNNPLGDARTEEEIVRRAQALEAGLSEDE